MKVCGFCQKQFQTSPTDKGQGQRRFCDVFCRNKAAAVARSNRVFAAVCSIDGCGKPANRVGAGLCEMHYVRGRRNGTFEYIGKAKAGHLIHSHGYIRCSAKGHPRALGSYRAYEHRVVFYDQHGQGPFNCHWCAVTVTWDDMHVDHVDGHKDHNELSNLVASCALCNQGRGRQKLLATLTGMYGITLDGVTKLPLEWADSIGISTFALRWRLKHGWSLRSALTVTRGKTGPMSRRRPIGERGYGVA